MIRTIGESTGDDAQSMQAEKQDVPGGTGGASGTTDGGGVGGSIKNLSTVANSAKFKKSKLTKTKKSDLPRANSSGTDFLTFKAKKAFIHL